MPSGFISRPKILRGAFVEYGLSLPPLIVPFQFNPVQLSRNRRLSYPVPTEAALKPSAADAAGDEQKSANAAKASLRTVHGRPKYRDLLKLQEDQLVDIHEESIGLEIRLDATDRLDEGDAVTERFGIAPQLATLEQMVHPKEESLVGGALSGLAPGGFSFTKSSNPPMILFIWGRVRVLPVNIDSMAITETEFSADLNPIRATVSVNMTVIEGPNAPYRYSKAMKEAMSVLNIATQTRITDVVIPG